MNQTSPQLLVVGIGASAGGIEALQTFFANAPAGSGCAYVVILHLSPEHDSQLPAILQSVTELPVTLVTERVRVQSDHVYVVPPNQHLTMVDGKVHVSPNLLPEERGAPIDIFFRTLAESHQGRGVCVILSGTGADGSMGLKRVKERGGAVFVQNPREAAFNEMPRSAIATDLVDDVLPVADIPARIATYRASLGTVAIPEEPEQRPEQQQQALREVFALLRARTGHDFANYKRATVLRRIERRITVRGLPDLPSYASFLHDHPDEVQALLKDLLISVTNFFRDREAFTALEQEILPRLFHGKGVDLQVRLWVVGCATGEEAYSLAMLCAERTFDVLDAPSFQVFASDIDEAAIAHAREGLYTTSDLADVSPERLRRFFIREDTRYRVRHELRETVLFANHNILKDPPFSHIDLVSCRNVLIYFNRSAQKRVMGTLHFALNAGGYLFLGTAESADGASDLFATVSREQHIFQHRPVGTHPLPLPDTAPILRASPPRLPLLAHAIEPPEHARERISENELHQQLLEQYAPPSLVVNQEFAIVHVSERAGRYLQLTGEFTADLIQLIRPELRGELRSALNQALERRTKIDVRPLPVRIEEHAELVTLRVRPVFRADNPEQAYLLVLFEAGATPPSEAELLVQGDEPATRQLEEENARLRRQLRTSSEQYEYQAEELRVTNEELQALNEELRSSAEELETSKEELQSINEELRTVNQELKVKVEEATLHSTNLQNLVNAAEVGTIFLDRQLHVKLFTPAARALFNLIPADYGRPLADITHRLVDVDVLADAGHVLVTLQKVEREVRTTNERVYVLRVLPYRMGEDRIGGVVITFFDITERTRAEAAVRESEAKYRTLFETIDEGVCLFEPLPLRPDGLRDYRYIAMNPAMQAMFGVSDLSGQSIRDNFPNEVEDWYDDYDRVLATGQPIRFQRESEPQGMVLEMFVTRVEDGSGLQLLAVMQDVTERKRRERQQEFLLWLGDALRSRANAVAIHEAVTHLTMEYFGADRCYYSEIDGDRAVIRHDAGRGDLPSVAGTYPLGDMPIFKAIVDAGRPFVVHDAATTEMLDENLRQLCIQLEVISFVDVPVIKDGRPVGILCITQRTPRDWTDGDVELAVEVAERTWAAVERARAEQALCESEGRLRTLVENLPGGAAFIVDRDLRYRLAEGEALYVAGFTPQDYLGRTIFEVLSPELAASYEPLYRQALAGEAFEYEHTAHGRSYISRGTPLHTTSGEVYAVLAVSYDISDRKRAEGALRESEARFRTLADTVPQLIWTNNSQGQAIYFNQRWYDYSGLSEAESVGPGWQAIVHPDDAAGSLERWRQALSRGGIFESEYRLRGADGTYRWHLGRNVPLRNEVGAIIGWFGSATDIEALKQAEAARQESAILRRLAKAQEEERLRIARDLHDQLGQLITGLLLQLKQLEAPAQGTVVAPLLPPVQALATDLAKEAHRIAVNLRPTALEDVGLVAALERLVADWSRQAGVPAAFMSTGFERERLPREIEVAMFRVAQEALTNVQKHTQATNVSVVVERRGSTVVLIIEDNGRGFGEEETPAADERPHLGLLGMRERVAQIGGTLEIESSPGSGVTLFVRVPLSSQP